MQTLSSRDLSRLTGLHPDLVRVVKRVALLSTIPFTILEGLRTMDRQRELLAKGATTTLNSRHLDGHAVDIAPMIGGEISWAWPQYYELAKVVKSAAQLEGVAIEWGGDWVKFKDGPHWQLPFRLYPSKGA